MTTTPTTLIGGISAAFALLSAASPFAQTAAPTDAGALEKYDKNKNGILDAAERAEKANDESKESGTITLSPFEVTTDKDVGYAAGNTLSGGGGALNFGRHIQHKPAPLTSHYLSLMDRMGVQGADRFADSTGRLANI